MSDIDDISRIRRERLQQLVDSRFDGGRSEAARGLGLAPQTITDVLNERRNIGEVLARRIEVAAGLAPGWLDKSTGRTPAPDGIEIVVNGEVIATVPAGSQITLRLAKR